MIDEHRAMGSGQSVPQAVTVETTTLPSGQQVAAVAQASPETGPPTTLGIDSASTSMPFSDLNPLDVGRPATYDIPRTSFPYTAHEGTSPDPTKLPSQNLLQSGLTDAATAQQMCDANPNCTYYVYQPSTKTYAVFAVPNVGPQDLDAYWLPQTGRSTGDPPITYVKDT